MTLLARSGSAIPGPAVLRALLLRLDIRPFDALPLLTLILLVTSTADDWYLRGPLVALAALGAVYRRWLLAPAFWYAIATLLGTHVYLRWESSDNHQYLFVYWALALCGALSLPKSQQQPALVLTSRWLLGLCMLLAVAWKLALANYRDGSFFEFTLLADERFARFASALVGLSQAALAENRRLVELLRAGHLQGLGVECIALQGASRCVALARAMTWWTVAIEGALAVAFLAPDRPRIAMIRNALLLLFAVTTYAVAPVRGFGWMLMLLGLAQCDERDRHFRPIYLAALLLIQAYSLPWAAIVERLAAG